nr:HAMP domain-containing sensor histidine kinase [Nannocystis sp.]
MSYVDELRRYLEAVQNGSVRWVELGPDELRRHQRALLLRFEAAPTGLDMAQGHELGAVFDRWTRPEFLASLVEPMYAVAHELGIDPGQRGPLVDELLAWLVEEAEPYLLPAADWHPPASMRRRALQQVGEAAARELLRLDALGLPPLARYASRLGLVRAAASSAGLSTSGDFLLRLPPRDATRWLVALELARSGPSDPWALAPSMLQHLLKSNVGFSHRDHAFARLAERDAMDAELATMRRLTAFGLVAATTSDGEYEKSQGIEEFAATSQGREVFTELLGESALAVLAHAVVTDQVAGTSGDLLRVSSPREHTSAAMVESVRHMRMFAHEIRNSLVPVQIAFEHLWRHWPAELPQEPISGLKHTIHLGLARIFQAVEESARVAKLAPAPPEPFDVAPALRDAIGALQIEFSHEIGLRIEPENIYPAVVGHRERFILVVVNLLRNARQAGGEAARVELTLAVEADAIVVTIDDDGPGVPAEHQTRVFEPGFSLRSDGSGHGLALVREVIEGELGGRVLCSSGPRGGARFTVRFSSASRGAL